MVVEKIDGLDMESVEQLVAALGAYRGAILVVSHNRHFLEVLGVDRELRLGAEGDLLDSN